MTQPRPGSARRGALAITVASVFFSFPRIGAQEPSAVLQPPLDLRTAVQMALAASPGLEAAQDGLLAAEARREFAVLQYVPSVVASGAYTHSGPVDPGTITVGPPVGSIALAAPLEDSTSFRLALQQPLYTGGRIEAGIAAAQAAAASAQAELRTRRRGTAALVEQAWWNLVLAAESKDTVAENLAAVSAHRADAERRLAQGTGTKSELLSWEMQEVEAGLRSRAAATDLEAARARLNILLGLPWDSPTTPETPGSPNLAAVTGPTTTAALLVSALSSRPELSSARARIAAQEATESQARAALLPSVYLTGSMTYADPNPKAFPQRSGFELLWDLGLMASIDLGRMPAARDQISDARAQTAQARAQLAQTRDSLTLELIQAQLDLVKARDRYESSNAAVTLAEENVRVQNDRFSAGLAIAAEAADAEASLLAAKLDRFRSRVQWELARAALRDAAGGDAASELATGVSMPDASVSTGR